MYIIFVHEKLPNHARNAVAYIMNYNHYACVYFLIDILLLNTIIFSNWDICQGFKEQSKLLLQEYNDVF